MTQCLICDHVKAVVGIVNVEITKELLMSVEAARQQYKAYQTDKSKEQEKEKCTKKQLKQLSA